MNIEAHISYLGNLTDIPEGWKTSRIDGDPLLGPGVKNYLTKHYTDIMVAIADLSLTLAALQTIKGINILRHKIELVIIDHKYCVPEKENDRDVHTEHCCLEHGCKYGDDDCPVETGRKRQSYQCEYCSESELS